MVEIDDYAWLTGDEGAAWLAKMRGDQRPALVQLGALRKDLSAERAGLVVEQIELRRRGREKFGELAERMFFAPVLLEQATELAIARYKAGRMRSVVGTAPIHDFCCGIGGDLLGLATGGPARGWDLAPVACLLAAANLRAAGCPDASSVSEGDVAGASPTTGEAWHADPDRRAAGGRSTVVDRMSPPPEVIDVWRATCPAGAVKLAPAAETPAAWKDEAEREWISSRRECRQQVAWFGTLATSPGEHRATLLGPASEEGTAAISTFAGKPDALCESTDAPKAFVVDVDPSVHAAGLVGAFAQRHGLARLGAGGGYLTGDRPTEAPLAAWFAVRECLPLRVGDVATALAGRGVGRVEVKKRGVDLDLEKLRRQLKLRGEGEATVILTRIGVKQIAILAERVLPS